MSAGYVDEEEAIARINQQVADRAYWETLATPVIAAWLQDYDDAPPFDQTDRALVLQTLVELGAARPASVKKLQTVWRKWNKGKGPCPHHLFAPAPDSESDADMAPEEEKSPSGLPAPSPDATKDPAVIALLAQLVAERRALQSERIALRPQTPADSPSFVLRVPSPYSLHASTAPSGISEQKAAVVTLECFTCTRPRPPGASARWVCVCSLRGDLPANDPANLFLASQAAADRALVSSGASAASASTLHGQSTAPPAHGDPDQRRANSFLARAQKGAVFPVFASTVALSSDEVFVVLAQAFKASAYDPPSPELLELIRSGKLLAEDLGWCLPRRRNARPEDALVFVLNEQGQVVPAPLGSAPALLSSHALFTALTSTILPALEDRPAARAEWLALARTALELEADWGWPAALEYVSQLLGERVAQRKAFAEPSRSCLATVEHARSRPGSLPAFASGGPVSVVTTHAPPRKKDEACHHWNNGVCSREPCQYQHCCAICSSNHTKADCPKKGGAGGNKPGGRGKFSIKR